MYSLPRMRLCSAQQPLATSALLLYVSLVGSTVLSLAMQGDGDLAVPERVAVSTASDGSTEAGAAAAEAGAALGAATSVAPDR